MATREVTAQSSRCRAEARGSSGDRRHHRSAARPAVRVTRARCGSSSRQSFPWPRCRHADRERWSWLVLPWSFRLKAEATMKLGIKAEATMKLEIKAETQKGVEKKAGEHE